MIFENFEIAPVLLGQFTPNFPPRYVITSTNYMLKSVTDWIFQIIIEYYKRIHLYLWAVAGYEIGTLSIRAQSFNSYLIWQDFY